MAGINKNDSAIKRGDVWVTDLRPGIGREVAKKRPTLIISNNTINSISPTVIVLPISSQIYNFLGPERIFLSANDIDLKKDSVVLVYQIRAIDKKRLGTKIGNLSKTKMQEVEKSLKLILNLP